ncbi:MAG: type II secretion system protein [Candidatus Gastranaerophilaceae bacterium]
MLKINCKFGIKRKTAFTLAEVLITLGVIGVVAALTMPTLLKNIAERSNSEAQANLAQKITKSMDLMRADGGLERTYNSTDEFVDEFSKYIKISTRCDADHIADCWPTKTVTTSDGETYDVSKAKTGKNLNLKDNKSNNVGIILADGATLILTYNPNAGIIGDGDTVTPSFADLPIGFGRTKKFAYTTSVTDSIDFVMDVNGFKGPNSEARNGKQYDIRSFKVAKFSKGCAGNEIKGIGCVYQLPSYSPIKAGSEEMKKWDPYWTTEEVGIWASDDNSWAGAKKACDDIGMSLPDKSKLQSLAKKTTAEKEQLGLPTDGWFWSSLENDARYAYSVGFTYGDAGRFCKFDSSNKVLCVGD